jgi:hypothetical protein
VPFVFLTGYGASAVDKRFAGYPMLQKPVAPEALREILRGDAQRSRAVA